MILSECFYVSFALFFVIFTNIYFIQLCLNCLSVMHPVNLFWGASPQTEASEFFFGGGEGKGGRLSPHPGPLIKLYTNTVQQMIN